MKARATIALAFDEKLVYHAPQPQRLQAQSPVMSQFGFEEAYFDTNRILT